MYMSFGIRKMSAAKAQGVFWVFTALMGASLSSIFLVYTGASITRVFFITAGTFGAMSIYGYTTKRDLTKLSISKNDVSFNVYHRTSDFPAYKITKNLKPKNESKKYIIKNAQNKVINNSENLQNLIKKIIWKKFKLVN